MEKLFRAVDLTTTFIGRAVGQLFFVVACITMLEVILRYVFNTPTTWSYELAVLYCGIAWMLSVGYVTQQKSHISITILYSLSPPRVQWWLDTFAMVAGVVVLSILAYACFPLMHDAFRMGEMSGTPFDSPEPMISKTALFVGVAMYVVQLAVNLIRHLRSFGAWR